MPKTAQERVVAPAAAKGAVAPRVVVPRAALPTPSSYMSSRSLDVIPLVIPRSRMGACCHMRPMDPWPHAVVQIGTSPITSERDGHMVSEAQSGFRTRKCVLPESKRSKRTGVRHTPRHAPARGQRGPRPIPALAPRARPDRTPALPPPGAARVRCHLACFSYLLNLYSLTTLLRPDRGPGPATAPLRPRLPVVARGHMVVVA